LDMPRVSREKVRTVYNDLDNMWGADRWHAHTKAWLDHFLAKHALLSRTAQIVLHVGSAGTDYGVKGGFTCHIDVAEKKLAGVVGAIVGDVHSLPIAPGTVDLCTCVGSVLNYCDAVISLLELAAVVKPGGHLLIEFESSDSWEYIATPVYGLGVTSTLTFYSADPDCRLWVYSSRFIKDILVGRGFVVRDESRAHIVSSMVYRITKNERLAASFAVMDKIARRIPFLRRGASNIILLCQRLP